MPRLQVHTLVLSDMHLGSVLCRPRAILRTLATYDFECLLVLGDGIDNAWYRLWWWLPWHWKVIRAIHEQVERGVSVIWVLGNHDRKLAPLILHFTGAQVCEELVWDVNGVRCYAVHGDSHDDFLMTSWWRNAWFTFWYIFFALQPSQWILRWVKSWHPRWRKTTERIASRVIAAAVKKNAQLAFFGHAHFPIQVRDQGVVCQGAGSFLDYPSCAPFIDHSGKPSVHIEY